MRLRVFVVVLMVSVVGFADTFVNVDPSNPTIGSFASFGVFPTDSHLKINGNTIDAVLKFNFPNSVLSPPVSEKAPNGIDFFSWFPGDLLFYVGSNMYGIALVNHGFSVTGAPPDTTGVDALKVYKTNSFLTANDLLSGLGFTAKVDYRENAPVWLANANLFALSGGSLTATGIPGSGSPFIVTITGTLPQAFADDVATNGFTAYFASTECANGYMKTEQDPVPEPASLALFGTGLFGLGMLRHRFPRAK